MCFFFDFFRQPFPKTSVLEATMRNNFETIFKLAKKQDRLAQKNIFELFSGKMLFIAKSYVQNQADAEDILIKAFHKCFMKIEDCNDYKSFEYWLRKIIVNDSVSFLRKNKSLLYVETAFPENFADEEDQWFADKEDQNIDLKEIFIKMPEGYRLIFNLYVFENKKHQEIAEMLNISTGTSKSQLCKSKKWLKDYLNKQHNEKFITK